MKLSALEQQSSAWKRVEAEMQSQLKSLRTQNDGDLDSIATAKLRGRIAAIKTILALGEDPQPVQASADQ